jgi:hypothetical protein
MQRSFLTSDLQLPVYRVRTRHEFHPLSYKGCGAAGEGARIDSKQLIQGVISSRPFV